MPRIRYLKPEFFDDEELCQLKPLARLMFAGLWCWADREGRLKDQPTRLKNTILGYDNCDADKLLGSLAVSGMIVRYEADGEKYIQIRHFLRHQRPHTREVPSTYPAPTQPYLSNVESTSTSLDDAEALPKARPEPPEQIGNRTDTDKEQERQPPPLRETDPAVARAFTAYENLAGLAPKTVADAILEALDDGVLPRWIEAACEEAALNNARNWKYVSAILKRWGRDGFKADRREHAGGGTQERTQSGLELLNAPVPGIKNFDFAAADERRVAAERRRTAAVDDVGAARHPDLGEGATAGIAGAGELPDAGVSDGKGG